MTKRYPAELTIGDPGVFSGDAFSLSGLRMPVWNPSESRMREKHLRFDQRGRERVNA